MRIIVGTDTYVCLTPERMSELLENYLTAADYAAKARSALECYQKK